MMPEFHDDWDELAIVRSGEKAEKILGANGPDGISNIEHVAIGNRAGRRQRS